MVEVFNIFQIITSFAPWLFSVVWLQLNAILLLISIKGGVECFCAACAVYVLVLNDISLEVEIIKDEITELRRVEQKEVVVKKWVKI